MTERYKPDMSVIHHSHMLNDKVRIDKYKKAISETIAPHDNVVDIGSGCGILSMLSAQKTTGQVYGIEYFEFAISLSKELCNKKDNIEFIKNSSFQTSLSDHIHAIVTETIGQIGPEEHMVEAIWDFCRRHPSIEKIIPSTLSIFAQPVHSAWFDEFRQEKFFSYNALAEYNMSSKDSDYIINDYLGRIIFQNNLSSAHIFNTDTSTLLTSYKLGVTSSSSFTKVITLSEHHTPVANALHLYFESELNPGNILDTHYSSPLTHWQHSFVLIPPGKHRAMISYRAGDRFISCEWE
ncbi:50S ribosomal protein L11 methyltransferase [Klebsiella aerogenes]|uniref:50S ribosomal protein L11 methyltransferase n=1 Tax=Klebsiella aerogenes TaxID=548 RepID=UPI001BD075D5|nr:50S ribosomal protein L11 methyltransferase [Klebsiella aerogenes]